MENGIERPNPFLFISVFGANELGLHTRITDTAHARPLPSLGSGQNNSSEAVASAIMWTVSDRDSCQDCTASAHTVFDASEPTLNCKPS